MLHLNLPTPIDLIDTNYQGSGKSLFIKRDDLIHPWVNGNKWRKFKGHIINYYKEGYHGIITFGGAYSNHLVAVACACYELGINSTGIIRSYGLDDNNPLIKKLMGWGMKLIAVTPAEYRQKENSSYIRSILDDHKLSMIIPEGGTSQLSYPGLKDQAQEIIEDPNYMPDMTIMTSIGTGGMLAGLYRFLPTTHQFIVGSPFKSPITKVPGLAMLDSKERINFQNASYAKNFGRFDPTNVTLINEFYQQYGVLLDPIYTVKVLRKLNELINTNHQDLGQNILLIHSGGLPGVVGFNYQNNHQDQILWPASMS